MRTDMQQVQVRIPIKVHQTLKQEAATQDRSVNWLINRLLAEALAKKEAPQ